MTDAAESCARAVAPRKTRLGRDLSNNNVDATGRHPGSDTSRCHRQRRQPGQTATAYDCEHETCLIPFELLRTRTLGDSRSTPRAAAQPRDAIAQKWKAPGIHDTIMQIADIPLI
jgi:hypothetical protein